MKQCRTCKIPKPLDQFSRHLYSADKHEYRCKECERKRAREYAARPERKKKQRKYSRDRYRHTAAGKRSSMKSYLKRHYGLAIEVYDQMLETQKGVCDICKQPETITNEYTERWLSVDHDHETGKIRGLLCSKCNSVIGYAKDNIQTLKNAITYLEKHR